MNSAVATAAAKSAGGAQPLEIAKQSATTKPELVESSGEAGSPWSKAGGTTKTAVVAAVAMPVDEARPPGFTKHSTSTQSDIAVSSGEAGLSGSRANGTNSVGVAAGAGLLESQSTVS